MKILNFRGPLKLTPFLQSFYRKSPIWRSKVQVFEGQLSGRVPPPSSVRYVLTPPIPVSEHNLSNSSWEKTIFLPDFLLRPSVALSSADKTGAICTLRADIVIPYPCAESPLFQPPPIKNAQPLTGNDVGVPRHSRGNTTKGNKTLNSEAWWEFRRRKKKCPRPRPPCRHLRACASPPPSDTPSPSSIFNTPPPHLLERFLPLPHPRTEKKLKNVQSVTLPSPQKSFVIYFFEFARGFGIERRREFLVNLLWSPFPRK